MMNEHDNKKIAGLLDSIDGSLSKLDELEQSYKQQKEQITTDLASSMRQLAALSDSKATRAQTIRELYWNKKLPATLISEAFGLKVSVMKRIAGALIVNVPCSKACGGSVKRTYKSRTELEDEARTERRQAKYAQRYPDDSYLSSRNACEECKKRENAEREAKEAQRKEAIRRRKEQLRNMPWDEYTETNEWIAIRNSQIHDADYKCQICQAGGIGLHVFFDKDTPQDYPDYIGHGYNYFVVCHSCIPRCSDLIDRERGEYIKREFMREVMDWNQER
jgi:hypothetical protein